MPSDPPTLGVLAPKCTHWGRTEYVAEYAAGGLVMWRDYHRCLDCGAEYSLEYRKWSAPLTPSASSPGRSR